MQCYHFQLNGNEGPYVLRNVTRDLKNSKFRTKEGQISLHHQGKQSPRTEVKRQKVRHGERVQSQISAFPRSGMDNCLMLEVSAKIVYILGDPIMVQHKRIQQISVRLDPWPRSVGWGSSVAMICGVILRHSSHLALL